MAHLAQKKVVVIDNNPANMKLFVEILKQQGFDVYTAHDGQEGLRAIQSHHPDLVIMDKDLPKLSAQQLVQFLENNSNFSVIPTMCIVPQGTTIGDFEAVFNSVLKKPFTVKKLVRYVSEVIEKNPIPNFSQNNDTVKKKKMRFHHF